MITNKNGSSPNRFDFHGSYAAQDVTFLLKPVDIQPTDTLEKERLIQSGRKHYSEMLAVEKTPDERYMELFHRALVQNRQKFAAHVASLCRTISMHPGKEIVIVSLARAGTPVGVLLSRGLKAMGRAAMHYSISIIRDRGIDMVALDYIITRHRDADIFFVDGWTGKGAITNELNHSVSNYNNSRGTAINTRLAVVADLAGCAGLAATAEDYLIPSAILNATVSGLVSRTVLSDLYVGPGDFHACAFYAGKAGEDLSRFFVDTITPLMLTALSDIRLSPICHWDFATKSALKLVSDQYLESAMHRYGLTDRNRVKPGIGESSRALLRRVPDRLIVSSPDAEDVEHLISLASTQGVPIEKDRSLPYRAAVIIQTLGE